MARGKKTIAELKRELEEAKRKIKEFENEKYQSIGKSYVQLKQLDDKDLEIEDIEKMINKELKISKEANKHQKEQKDDLNNDHHYQQ